MKYKIFVSFSSPEQFSMDIVDDYEIILPYYRLNEFQVNCLGDLNYYVSLPLVVRNKDIDKLTEFIEKISGDSNVKGVIANNTESLMLLEKLNYEGSIISGPGVYVWNNAAVDVVTKNLSGFVYPYELSKYELKEINTDKGILTIYGKAPLMISANCIRNTNDRCCKGSGDDFGTLVDRKNMALPVHFQCENCYNVIYNAIPISLHEFMEKDVTFADSFLLSFTNESKEEVKAILDYYRGKTKNFPVKDFTKAYFKHGVM